MIRNRNAAVRSSEHVSEIALQGAKHVLDHVLDLLKTQAKVSHRVRRSMQYSARELADAVITLAIKDPTYYSDVIVVESKKVNDDLFEIVFRRESSTRP